MLKFNKSAISRGTLGGGENSSSLNLKNRIAFPLPKMLGFWAGVGVLAISFAATVDAATTMPTCAELGYNNNEYYCASTTHSYARLKCPWNTHWMACNNSGSPSSTSGFTVDCDNRNCASLGYTKTAAQCANYYALKCPFDDTKFFCGGNGCIDDGYTANPTCPSGQEIASTQNCPNDSSLKKVTCRPTCESQGYTLDESACKTNYQNCEKCSTANKYKGSGTYYNTKTCAKGDILFSNKKCYPNNTAPTYQSKIAVVYALASDSLGINSAMALTETSTTVSPGGSCNKVWHYRYSGGWGNTKSDIFNDKTYTMNGSTPVYHNNNTAQIRSNNSSCIYSCSNGGFVPTVRDWYYYKNNSQAATKFTSNGGTAPNMNTLYWVSNIGPHWYGSGQYNYVDDGRYRVKPSSISANSPFESSCGGSGDYGCGSNCPNNNNADCAKVRCVYTF